jgi:hypothetical protein
MASKVTPAVRDGGTRVKAVIERVGTAVTDVGGQVREVAADPAVSVARGAPAALAASRRSVDGALVMLRSSSTESLWLGAVFSAGASSGLLLSRAPRVLAALASVSALVLGGMVLGRRSLPVVEPARGDRR